MMFKSKQQQINPTRRQLVLIPAALVTSSLLATSLPAMAASDQIYTSFLSNKAVGGYDPVAYFTNGVPTKGNSRFSLEHEGAEWLFASQENLDAFKSDPDQYAPQYGGYCAYAAALGQTAKGDPQQWEIVDNKLYLNINADIKKKWSGDKDFYIPKADANWPSILN